MRADFDKAEGTATVRRRSRAVSLPKPAWPYLHPESIRWSGGACRRDLAIDLTFENRSETTTRPVCAIVQVAELGAFVPWHPLTALRVPAMPAHETLTVSTVVDPNACTGLHLNGFGTPGSSPHFAGNLNVFVPGALAAERHWSRRHVAAQVTDVASFHVGDGRADDYTFSFECESCDWTGWIEGHAWNVPVHFKHAHLQLRITASRRARSGRCIVWVSRASTGQRVPIEFELRASHPAP